MGGSGRRGALTHDCSSSFHISTFLQYHGWMQRGTYTNSFAHIGSRVRTRGWRVGVGIEIIVIIIMCGCEEEEEDGEGEGEGEVRVSLLAL